MTWSCARPKILTNQKRSSKNGTLQRSGSVPRRRSWKQIVLHAEEYPALILGENAATHRRTLEAISFRSPVDLNYDDFSRRLLRRSLARVEPNDLLVKLRANGALRFVRPAADVRREQEARVVGERCQRRLGIEDVEGEAGELMIRQRF